MTHLTRRPQVMRTIGSHDQVNALKRANLRPLYDSLDALGRSMMSS